MAKKGYKLEISSHQWRDINKFIKTLGGVKGFETKAELDDFLFQKALYDKGKATINEYYNLMKLKAEQFKDYEQNLKDIKKAFNNIKKEEKQTDRKIKAITNARNKSQLQKLVEIERLTDEINIKKQLAVHQLSVLDNRARQQADILTSENNNNIKTITDFRNLTYKPSLQKGIENINAYFKEDTETIKQDLLSDIKKQFIRQYTDTEIQARIDRIETKYKNYFKSLATKTTKQEISTSAGDLLEYESTQKEEVVNLLQQTSGRMFEAFSNKYAKGAIYTNKFLIKFLNSPFTVYSFYVRYPIKYEGHQARYGDYKLGIIDLKFKDIIDTSVDKKTLFERLTKITSIANYDWLSYGSDDKISVLSQMFTDKTQHAACKRAMKKELVPILSSNKFTYNTKEPKWKKHVEAVDMLVSLGAKILNNAIVK